MRPTGLPLIAACASRIEGLQSRGGEPDFEYLCGQEKTHIRHAYEGNGEVPVVIVDPAIACQSIGTITKLIRGHPDHATCGVKNFEGGEETKSSTEHWIQILIGDVHASPILRARSDIVTAIGLKIIDCR